MESIKLEDLLVQQINNIRKGIVDKRVESFNDFKNRFTILKSKVTVKIALKEGIEATVDVTDYFNNIFKGE